MCEALYIQKRILLHITDPSIKSLYYLCDFNSLLVVSPLYLDKSPRKVVEWDDIKSQPIEGEKNTKEQTLAMNVPQLLVLKIHPSIAHPFKYVVFGNYLRKDTGFLYSSTHYVSQSWLDENQWMIKYGWIQSSNHISSLTRVNLPR